MRVPVNLAREPFKNERPLVAGAVAVGSILVITLLAQVLLFISERNRVADLRDEVARLDAQVARLNARETEVRSTLQRGDNTAVFERSVFLNSLIRPKSMSWTRMFVDLERVVPYNVKIMSIRQQINDRNEIMLDMVVAAQTAEPVIDMLKRMERSDQFSRTQVSSIAPPAQNDNTFKYRVTVNYDQQL